MRLLRLRLGILALLAVLASCGSSAASSTSSGSASSSGSAASSGSGSGASPGSGSGHCGPAGATTLASSPQARVYSWHGAVFGCSFARGRSFRLGSASRSISESQVNPVAVAGSVAAYGLSNFGVDTVRTVVVVRRLTDGAQLRSFPATQAVGAEGFQSVGSVAVKSDGAVAWIGVEHSIGRGGQVIEVHGADAAGSSAPNRMLDSGPAVGPASLHLHASTLSWRHGAATRHATLH